MSKPADVSQWAWDEAVAIYSGLQAPNLYNSEESLADHEKEEDIGDIARSLDAAKALGQAEQREVDGGLTHALAYSLRVVDHLIATMPEGDRPSEVHLMARLGEPGSIADCREILEADAIRALKSRGDHG